MLKKAISVILALSFLIAGLAGCTGSEPHGVRGRLDAYGAITEESSQSHPLVGTWVWDGAGGYKVVFRVDGTGFRGIDSMFENFEWDTPEAGHVLIRAGCDTGEHACHTTLSADSWSYEITGDMLTLTSRQIPGMSFHYRRL